MTSKLTRERLEIIKSWRETYGPGSNVMLPAEEAEELACLALAAMDSKPVFFIEVEGDDWINAGRTEGKNRQDLGLLPDGINYLYAAPQPLTDAEREELQELRRSYLALRGENEDLQAQLYEAESHADDAAEELQERRKADSESVAEVLSNRPGNGTSIVDVALPVGTQLYRHAQPAPVVPKSISVRQAISALESAGAVTTIGQAYKMGWNACRAAMLQASPVCTCPSGDGSLRWPCPVHAGSSPVIPDGYVLVPMRLTAENGAKGALSGEFSETKFVNCPECFGDDECETCDGSGKIEITVPVTWTTIKAIWVKGVEHFAVTAQEND
ncbi:hypothetical protein [Klebsiella pneumoniae]|uniref:hypothetical protein n=1 Tax=Klebsiella pneumoniae TaxID=573 RepID=UPI0027D2FDC9|nr:hypothetical protein [Klebsiella pneumoniae]